MPAGPNTGTRRSQADLLELYADYKPAHSSNRQLDRDKLMSLEPQKLDIRRKGAIMDGATLGDQAWADAITECRATGAELYIPPGILQLSAAAEYPSDVSIGGAGLELSIVRVSGAVNGLNGHDAGPGYAHASGILHDFWLQGAAGALVGIDVNFRDMPRLVKVRVTGFARQGAYFNNCIMPKTDHCLFQSNGGASYAQVEVENSTTFLWDHTYISGGNVTTIAGLAIDKTTTAIVMGGASESTGIPVRLGGKADAAIGTNGVLLWGIDLENPNNGADCYIECGAGWTGAANQGVTRLTIGGVNQSPSGSTTVKYGIKAQNTDSVHLLPNKWGTPTAAAGGVSNIELVGLTNIRWSATLQSSNIGAGLSYVRENGATRKDALPYLPWEQGGRNLVFSKQVLAVNSATPDTGGVSFVSTGNTVPTTVTNITGGGVDGQVLMITFGDANTTLKHNGGGSGQLWLFDAQDNRPFASSSMIFMYDSASAMWRQIGHNVGIIGNLATNWLAVTGASGQVSLIVTGADATVSINLTPKGAGFVKSNISSQFAAHRVGSVAGGNWLDLFPNVAGSPPRVVADGADADIDLKLEPKGAGMLNINLPASIAPGAGGAATLGLTGAPGPTVVAQNGWLKVKVNGAIRYIALWA
jgi:hypothetical protein